MSKKRISKKAILDHLSDPSLRYSMRRSFFRSCQQVTFRYTHPVLFSRHRDLGRFEDVYEMDGSFEAYYANWCLTQRELFDVDALMEQFMADLWVEEKLSAPDKTKQVKKISGCI